jgi:hypothetical protein
VPVQQVYSVSGVQFKVRKPNSLVNSCMGGIGKLLIYLVWQRVNDFIAAHSAPTMCNM